MEGSRQNLNMNICSDIFSVLAICDEVGWQSVSLMSTIRIIYLASVTYIFTHEQDDSNPFSGDYNFSLSLRGPYCSDIENAYIFIASNEYVKTEGGKRDVFFIFHENFDEQFKVIQSSSGYDKRKYDWLKVIIYSLALYGEDKVYDFIFRDPEFYEKSASNQLNQVLDLDSNNKTIQILNEFKAAFEETLENEVLSQISDRRYLELYFEYVFKKILKGESFR